MRLVYITDRGKAAINIVWHPTGLILRGGDIDAWWQPSDCVWMVPGTVSPD